MRYLVLLVIIFGVYFWAVKNIGDKYVTVREVNLPAEPSSAITDLHEGKYSLQQIKQKQAGEPEPTLHVVEY